MLYTSNWRPSASGRAKIFVPLTEITGLEKQHIKSFRQKVRALNLTQNSKRHDFAKEKFFTLTNPGYQIFGFRHSSPQMRSARLQFKTFGATPVQKTENCANFSMGSAVCSS